MTIDFVDGSKVNLLIYLIINFLIHYLITNYILQETIYPDGIKIKEGTDGSCVKMFPDGKVEEYTKEDES